MTVPSLDDAAAGRPPQHLAEPAACRGVARTVGGWVLVVLGGFVGMTTSTLTLAVVFVAALGAAIEAWELWVGLLGFTLGALVAMLGFTMLGVRRWLARALLGLLVVACGFVAFWVVILAIDVVQSAVS